MGGLINQYRAKEADFIPYLPDVALSISGNRFVSRPKLQFATQKFVGHHRQKGADCCAVAIKGCLPSFYVPATPV